jgi:tRNA A-37 threonylcarbamoyl transferase component Bud32
MAVAAAHGLVLRRAWPRDGGHLLLDLASPTGPSVAGQWFADQGRARAVAARTGAPAIADRGVVLQPAGADRRLPVLATLVHEPGAVLIAHRPERRAVVRRADGTYSKVVRTDRVAAEVRAALAARGIGLRVPEILDVDERGFFTTAALPGQTLHALLAARAPVVVAAARAVGAALAVLHAAAVPVGAPVHDGAAELAVLHRWERLARAHGVLADGPGGDCGLLGPSPALVPVHRDLHDKQVLVADDGTVGLLDFDLAAAGEAAMDLANLLVHLELRALQGVCPAGLARAAALSVLEGYAPSDAVVARLPVYEAATRRRLAAVYGWRPGHAAAARLLAARP